MEQYVTVKEKQKELEDLVFRSLFTDQSGKYRWVYELPMLSSFFLLFEVWKALAVSAFAVFCFMLGVNIAEGGGLQGLLFSLQLMAVVMGILFVLSIPAYYIVTKANNGKYTVLFEMDDSGIDHVQIKTNKAKALDLLVTFTGAAAKSRTTTAAGLLSASGGSLYSRFSNVRRIRAYPKKHLITLTGRFLRNQVYVDDEDFIPVYEYIKRHCPNADIR
ncbi:MAG: hypothetical protein IJG59_06110 [Erysipelotrichaceae bacterium]|nr:hypothetical protein [Erysipelotrichaceae bacterium]